MIQITDYIYYSPGHLEYLFSLLAMMKTVRACKYFYSLKPFFYRNDSLVGKLLVDQIVKRFGLVTGTTRTRLEHSGSATQRPLVQGQKELIVLFKSNSTK